MSCQVMGIGSRGSTFPGEAKEERESDHRLLLVWPGREKNGQFSSSIVWEQRSDEYSTTVLLVLVPVVGTKNDHDDADLPSKAYANHFFPPTHRLVPVQPKTTRDGVEVVPIWKKRPNQYLTIKWPSFFVLPDAGPVVLSGRN